ncbi:MAG TPA: thioredoxin domain-containing protein, partial [Anaerolineales bacterium]|nr:thioredoxin domain-containing protein [Anaerolineales bacterium]
MLRVFDAVLTSNDMSLDRVLNAGLPVAMVFYDRDLPGDLRQAMDQLARQYAGKVLLVRLAKSDAAQAISRFGVRGFPTLVTVHAGKRVASLEDVRPEELKPHITHLLGEGPRPSERAAQPSNVGQTTAQGPIAVNEATFEREVLRSDRPVLVDFWAPWCAPCHMVAPTLEKLAHEQSNLKIAKLNVDENPGLASRYGAMSIPTMIIIQG